MPDVEDQDAPVDLDAGAVAADLAETPEEDDPHRRAPASATLALPPPPPADGFGGVRAGLGPGGRRPVRERFWARHRPWPPVCFGRERDAFLAPPPFWVLDVLGAGALGAAACSLIVH